MATSRSGLGLSRPRPRPRPRPKRTDGAAAEVLAVVPWRKVPGVVRLTAAILRAHEASSARTVREAIAIGRQLAEVKRLLAHGEFLAWAREAVPLGERTIQRWLSLAEFAEREPAEIDRLAHLGLTKLYRMAALTSKSRRELKLATPIPIPDTDGKKTIEVMTTLDLDRVIGGLATPPVPRKPIAKLVQSYRFRLAGLSVLTGELRARARDVDPGLASELVAELYGLAEALEATFDR